jgi:hypothetical protein
MTNLDDQLKQTFQSRLDAVAVPAGDARGARRTGARMRTRRRLTVAGVAAAVVAVALAGVVDARRQAQVGPSGQLGLWRELPTPPLSPRGEARMVWTGHEVIVLGGTTEVCPPTADCGPSPAGASPRDGAAYDPSTNTWRRIAPPPVDPTGAQLAVANGVVVLEDYSVQRSRWFTYDPDRDRWSRIGHVPPGVGDLLSAVGSRVYVDRGRGVASYDVTSSDWSLIPPDRIGPRLTTGALVATSSGPVRMGYDSTQPNDGTEPSLVLADVWDGTSWRRLPPSDQLDPPFAWTGHRLVNPSPFTENGGEVNGWGRDIPDGGTLDPATGVWGRLPAKLSGDPDGWIVEADGGGWFAVGGQAYDDDTGRVYALDRPDGAPDYAVSGAWADGRLLVFGGTDTREGFSGDALSDRAWLWTP